MITGPRYWAAFWTGIRWHCPAGSLSAWSGRQVRVHLQDLRELRTARDHVIVRIRIGCRVRNGDGDVLAKIVLITRPCARRVAQQYIPPHPDRAGCPRTS